MAAITLNIITPSKSAFTGEVHSVTIPGTKGSFQVLYNHAPLISTFEVGEIKLRLPDDKELHFATGGGTVEVKDNKVLILADSIEPIEGIDIERARKAEQKARERLLKREAGLDVTRAELALARSINRQKLYERYGR